MKAQAEALLKQAKSGADFAGAGEEVLGGRGSAKNGGDLDYFGRGRMVKEFEDAAFSLAPGAISDLVKTQFGFHIIKVVDKKPATTRPLERGAPADRRPARLRARADAGAATSRRRSRSDIKRRRGPRDGREGARPCRAGVRLLRARRSRSAASARRRRSAVRGVPDEGRRGGGPDARAARPGVLHDDGQAGRARPEARGGEGAREGGRRTREGTRGEPAARRVACRRSSRPISRPPPRARASR